MKITLLALTALTTLACAGPYPRSEHIERAYPSDGFTRSYEVTGITPGGIMYDGVGVDEAKLDFIYEEVVSCLEDAFPWQVLTPVPEHGKLCYDGLVEYPSKDEFVVVVEDEWRLTCDGTQQVLLATTPDSGCIAKGMDPTRECPCSWRSGFRTANDGTLLFITTPSMYMLSDVFNRYMTGCQDPWRLMKYLGNPQCGQPQVEKLPSE